ncbi:MAG: sigma-70 family RNA polymerase sigma factor [Bacteroidia bacterium]|nr:sigma-70 family RNA polymerase sigma factor [Bacteroidia bacterium]
MIDLLKEIRKKDKNAVTVLYNRYGKKLYGYAVYKWNLDEDEAWDLIYQTLYKIIETIDRYKFEDENKFAGFIFTAFVNNLRNLYQKKKKQNTETVELNEKHGSFLTEDESENEIVIDSEQMKYLKAELEQLEEWKKILMLMRAQDYSYEEISKYVNKPAGQLKVYYMRIKKNLTEKINERIKNSK